MSRRQNATAFNGQEYHLEMIREVKLYQPIQLLDY